MECVLWIREKSGSKEKSGSNQHVAITKAIHTPGCPQSAAVDSHWAPRARQSTPNRPPESPNRLPMDSQSAPIVPQWATERPS